MNKLQTVILSLMIVFGVIILVVFILHFVLLGIPFTQKDVGHNSFIQKHLGDIENLSFPPIRLKTAGSTGAGAYPDPAVSQVLYQCPEGRVCLLGHVWLYNSGPAQNNVVLGMVESGTQTVIGLQHFGTVAQNTPTDAELFEFVLRPGQVLAIWCNDQIDVEVFAYEYDENNGPITWYSTSLSGAEEVSFTVPAGKKCVMYTQDPLAGPFAGRLSFIHAGATAATTLEVFLNDQKLSSDNEGVSAPNAPDNDNPQVLPQILDENQTLRITLQPTSAVTTAKVSVHFSYILVSQ